MSGAAGGDIVTSSAVHETSFAVVHRHFPSLPARVASLVGAGDSLVAGCCAALLGGLSVEDAVGVGVAASRRGIETTSNVPTGPSVSFAALRGDARGVIEGIRTVTPRSKAQQLDGCGQV